MFLQKKEKVVTTEKNWKGLNKMKVKELIVLFTMKIIIPDGDCGD